MQQAKQIVEVFRREDTRSQLLVVIGSSAILWYFLSITCIGCELVTSRTKTSQAEVPGMDMYQFMSFSVTTISGTLATYLGLVLGFSSKSPVPSEEATPAAGLGKRSKGSYGRQPGAPGAATPAAGAAAPAPPATHISPLQKGAAWAYFFSLIYALVIYGITMANDTCRAPDPVIITLGQSILGLFGGTLAVILNVETP